MEKVKIRFLVICAVFAFVSVSCSKSDDLDNNPNKITRVQDGKGKVFLENGTFVDANLNYTQEQLVNALNSYEWEREYSFYYDNNWISDKKEIDCLPTKIHTNGIIEDAYVTPDDIWTFSISGKKITANLKVNVWSSAGPTSKTFTVISLDMSNNSGRIVMDEKINNDVEGFNTSSLYARMVWKAIIP